VVPPREVVLVFCRNPERGQVKTRLAATVGEEEALRIYCLLVEKTRLAVLGLPGVRRRVLYSGFVPEQDEWDPLFFEKKIQSAGDLGQRMAEAFRAAFAEGAERVVVVGTDCPELSPDLLARAFGALRDQAPVAIGPALDGGYYLLGMSAFFPELFDGIAWSTERVLAQTLQRAEAIGLTCHLLPPLRDVDTEEDWRSYLGAQP
jgi:rSAM/selenodomain-associated transferase 1